MWHEIDNIPKASNHVVYKIVYANKYIIVAGKTIERSIENINTGLKYFFKDTPMGRNPNDVFYDFYCHVDDFPFQQFSIEILSDTDKVYKHLQNWFLELRKSREDKKCLNMYFEPYIPVSTQRKKGSWINRGSYLNYMKWKQKFTNKMIE